MRERFFLEENKMRILNLAKQEDISRLSLDELAEKSGMGVVSRQLISFHIRKLKEWGFLDGGRKIVLDKFDKLGKETTIFSKCKHQFFEIDKTVNDDRTLDGILIMCALCGERRHLHADGRLEVLEKKE